MTKQKKQKQIFIISFIVFMLAIFYASYDISKRTTFPGSKPQLRERIKQNFLKDDEEVLTDSTKLISPQKDSLNFK
ncbi:MAG TPA: hypothetical protein PKC24_12965 [Cyclobacteriaceae bacterium]|nr:hypothetical protein [Cyclobacteriaceae bacterium]